ncbi:MAG: VOC family protein [Chloroflexi bacterium]|nr:VOC family protein [Chloroflexota bacterium]
MDFYFDHVHLYAPDLRKTAAWYQEKLGARLVKETKNPRMAMLHLDLNGARIIIAGPAQRPGPGPGEPYAGLEHFGLRVANMEAAIKELKDKGVRFLQELTVTPSGDKIAFMEAPDQTRIELTER